LYTLVTKAYLAGATQAQIAAGFSGKTNGIKYTGCTPDASTYKVQGTQASMNVAFTVTRLSDGRAGQGTLALTFVQEGGGWKLNRMIPVKA